MPGGAQFEFAAIKLMKPKGPLPRTRRRGQSKLDAQHANAPVARQFENSRPEDT
jgi:hypothetical protein